MHDTYINIYMNNNTPTLRGRRRRGAGGDGAAVVELLIYGFITDAMPRRFPLSAI